MRGPLCGPVRALFWSMPKTYPDEALSLVLEVRSLKVLFFTPAFGSTVIALPPGASGALSGFLNLPSCVSVVGNRLLICANLLRSRASPRMLSSRPDRSQSGVNGWYRAVAGHPFYVCFLFALTRWAGRRTIRSSGTGSQMRETASSEMSNPVGSFGSFR